MSRFSRAVVLQRAVRVSSALLLVIAVACADQGATPPGTDNTSSSLKVGDRAPAFALPSVGGEEISLADYRGKKAVLLYFSMGPG